MKCENKIMANEKEEFLKFLDIVLHSQQKRINVDHNTNKSVSVLEERNSKGLPTGSEMYQEAYPTLKGESTIAENQKKDLLRIHVFDKSRERRTIFQWPRQESLSKIGCFKDKWAMSSDFYVECDIGAFSWILQWLNQGDQIKLNAGILHSVIEAALSLNSPALLTECLLFWRANVRLVMRSGEWKTLRQHVVTQLASLFNNCSLEDLTKDVPNLQECLYKNFIISLNEPKPRPTCGHFSSLANIFQCMFCRKLLEEKCQQSVACRLVVLNPHGDVTWGHQRHPDWSLCDLITFFQEKHKQWRLVYWNLWARCHFLFCSCCFQRFPMSEISNYHSKTSFDPGRMSRTAYYLCCGRPHSRFQVISEHNGCHLKDHSPILFTSKEQEIFKIFKLTKHLIDPEKFLQLKIKMKSNVEEVFLHQKLSIVKRKYLSDQNKKSKYRKRKWSPQCNNASNQDRQRDSEEQIFRNIQALLSVNENWNEKNPIGGSYLKAEADWWKNEQNYKK